MPHHILHIRADTSSINPIEGVIRVIKNYIHYSDSSDFESKLLLISQDLTQNDIENYFTDIRPEQLLLIGGFSNRDLFTITFWKKLIRLVKDNHIEILQSHSYKSDLITLFLKLFTNTKIISTVHGYNPASDRVKSRIFWGFYRKLWYFFDHIIVVAQAMLEIPVFKRLNQHGKVSVVQNFLSEFPVSNGHQDIFTDSFTIICIGRLAPEKNQILLCQALKEIQSEKTFKCFIIGDGPERTKIEHYVRFANLEQQIELTGFQSDVLSYYQKADVLVIPSRYEGLPLSLLEAMSLKIPIIATDIGEIHSILQDGKGLLFERDNLSDLVDKLSFAMVHQRELAQMAEKAFNFYQDNFSPQASIQALLNAYEDVQPKDQL
jgi:glycosyltransferase involved in cell wall biosynthesis